MSNRSRTLNAVIFPGWSKCSHHSHLAAERHHHNACGHLEVCGTSLSTGPDRPPRPSLLQPPPHDTVLHPGLHHPQTPRQLQRILVHFPLRVHHTVYLVCLPTHLLRSFLRPAQGGAAGAGDESERVGDSALSVRTKDLRPVFHRRFCYQGDQLQQRFFRETTVN